MQITSLSETETLIQLALKCEQTGDISGALRLARQALESARLDNNALDCAQALTAVARYRFRFGQYETARQLAQEAMRMTDPVQEAQAAVHAESLLLLGMCALETNSLAECEHYYRSAANLAREIGHSLLFQRALHNLGSGVYLFRGQFILAIAADRQSLQICREKGYTDWAIFPLITLGIAYQISGQRMLTHETLKELRTAALPGSAGEGYACYVSGMLALDEDDFHTANADLTRALTLAEELGDPSLNLDTRLGLSRMCRLSGKHATARDWADDALRFAERVGYRIYTGRARLERGRLSWLMGDPTSAANDFDQAESIFLEMDLRYDLAEVRLLLTALYRQQQDSRVAVMLPLVSAAIQAGGYSFLLERERPLVYPLADYLNDPNLQLADAAEKLFEAIQRVPPKPLRVITLGRLELWVGVQRIDSRSLRQRRAGELLMYLLASPGFSLSSGQIMEGMCPEKELSAAVDFYHHAISALRRLLEPDLPDRRFPSRYLEVSEERVTLTLPPGSSIDFLEFEKHIQNLEWEKAAAIYQGEYLPMYRYAEWTIDLRQHLSDQFEQALLAQAVERLNAGQPAISLNLARRTLFHNAWQEQAVELGMRAALQLGDRATAMKLYQRLEKKLKHDLGIAPQFQLQRLYKEIRKAK